MDSPSSRTSDVSDWDDDYARLARAASLLRTTSHDPNGHNRRFDKHNLRDRSGQATSVRAGLDRLDNRLLSISTSTPRAFLPSAEISRRKNLVDGLRNQLGGSGNTKGDANGSAMSGNAPYPGRMGGGGGRVAVGTGESAEALRRQDLLIDDLAVGVSRLKTQSRVIHDESQNHVRLLDEMDANVALAEAGLEEETRRAVRLREEGSVWRLHLVIAGLSVLLFMLILMGLS